MHVQIRVDIYIGPSTEVLHFSWSAMIIVISSYELYLGSFPSFSSICLKVVLGLLELHMFFSVMNLPLVLDSLFLRSFIAPPSLHTFAPKYVNSSMSVTSISLKTVLSWFHAMILTTFVFSVLTFSTTCLASSIFVILS